jgi:Flp pilus assembly CpaF family ATPase
VFVPIHAGNYVSRLNLGTPYSSALTANSANGALQRLANLVLRGVSHQSQSVVEAEIKAGIDFVVHLNREQSHRYVYEILDRSAGNP